jgi:hypothetical protein
VFRKLGGKKRKKNIKKEMVGTIENDIRVVGVCVGDVEN